VTALRHILLADDDPRDVELTLNALSECTLASRVDVVHDGQQVLDYVRCDGAFAGRTNGDPAVILLDLKMPKLDGLDVLRTMAADPHLRTLPVVVLTSSSEERDVAESYRHCANAYVVKSVEFSEFVEAVRRLGMFWALVNVPPPG
jgi:CheY-like chemotaxis protein